MCELLDALEFAHDAGVIHRDIKPANVMLDSQGRTKLTDFGVARVTDADRTNAERTQAGTMVGTPAYMSPEQVQGHKVDRRTDIFSAGIILYQFLTGQKPFVGEGAWTVAKKIILDDPPVPSSLNMGVSPEFDRVVAKALAKNPEQRFATARDFARALKRVSEGKPAFEAEATTVVVPSGNQARTQAPHPPAPAQSSRPQASGEMELEFWRSIKDSEDPHDFELYRQQFPQGVYASLAGRKIARMRGLPGAEDSGTRPLERTTDGTRLHAGASRAGPEAKAMRNTVERTRPAADKTVKLAPAAPPAAEPASAGAGKRSAAIVLAILSLLAAAGAAAYFFVVKPGLPTPSAPGIAAEEKAKREAAEKAKLAAEAKVQRDAELQAKREAELQAQRAAEEEARAAVQAERQAKAARKAELQAKRAADLQAIREARARAQQDAQAKARLAAETSLWDSVRTSRNAAEYQKYLDRYPNGLYADMARRRVAALEEQKRAEEARTAAENSRAQSDLRPTAPVPAKKKDADKKKSGIVVPTF
jgi:serine/threonine-protein kinase